MIGLPPNQDIMVMVLADTTRMLTVNYKKILCKDDIQKPLTFRIEYLIVEPHDHAVDVWTSFLPYLTFQISAQV